MNHTVTHKHRLGCSWLVGLGIIAWAAIRVAEILVKGHR